MKVREDFFARKHQELGVALNEVQQKAVLHTEGPLLLLASPGSGKTTTIIMRIGYLIEELAVQPSRIKAVTFSRASASDMKERFKRFFPELAPVDFSTIHSFAFEVVRDHFRKTRTNYYMIEGDVDAEEEQETFGEEGLPLHKKIILRQIYKSIVGDNITEDQMEELTTYISYIKNKMLSSSDSVKCDVREAKRIFQEYEAYKSTGHDKLLLDFDDMLVIAERVLGQDPALLRKYQQRYDYFLTDESQDTSLVQHAIIEKLVRVHQNLCVVADDDQSIYSWRGAEPSYLLNFKQVYPQAATLYMEQNYRSTTSIVHVANQFIRRNKNRYHKNMFTRNDEGSPIRIQTVSAYNDQAKHLAKEIQKVSNLSEVAILYRNNSSSISLMNEFDRAGIPFYMKDADNRFFSHWIVEDILNFMRMTFTDKRADILERIHLKFNGYISKQQMAAVKTIQNNESVFDNLLQYVSLQEYQYKPILAAKETFQEMKGMPPLHAIHVIRERLGYDKALEKMCERLGFRQEYLLGIVNTLEEIAGPLETMEQFAARLKHLEALLKKAKYRKGQHAVTLSTFHSAKGLEFDLVYMIDLVAGIIPSASDKSEEDMEEATRLFYVGMTRAKRHLQLLLYSKKNDEQATESSFVTEVRNIINPPKVVPKASSANMYTSKKKEVAVPINPNAIKDIELLYPEAIIKHRAMGRGEVVRVDGDVIEIQFSREVKKLSVSVCIEKGLLELESV